MLTIDLVYSSSSSSVLGVGLDGLPMLREGLDGMLGLGGTAGGVPAGGVGRTETLKERVGRLLLC
jgi:hypothetical protein